MNMHVFLLFLAFNEQMCNFSVKRVSKWNVWRVFEASKRESKLNIIEEIDIIEDEWVNERFKCRKEYDPRLPVFAQILHSF